MNIMRSLRETPIGCALLSFWFDLPFWLCANLLFALSLVPVWLGLLSDRVPLAVGLTLPAAFVLSGTVRAYAQTILERPPHWHDLIGKDWWCILSGWAVLSVLALSFLVELPPIIFAVQCLIAVILSLLLPYILCLPTLLPINIRLTWRNAFVLVVHFPIISLGMVILAVLAGTLIIAHPIFVLFLPALWAGICTYTCYSLVHQITSVSF